MGIKETQNLMLISNPLKKLQKTHAKKVINEKVTELFCAFFNGFNLSIEFCVFTIPMSNFKQIYLLILALFANFKAKIGQNGSKKRKTVFEKKYVLEYLRSGRLLLVKKRQNRCAANVDSRYGWTRCDDSKKVLFSSITVFLLRVRSLTIIIRCRLTN